MKKARRLRWYVGVGTTEIFWRILHFLWIFGKLCVTQRPCHNDVNGNGDGKIAMAVLMMFDVHNDVNAAQFF